jgi:hypothetical protein
MKSGTTKEEYGNNGLIPILHLYLLYIVSYTEARSIMQLLGGIIRQGFPPRKKTPGWKHA